MSRTLDSLVQSNLNPVRVVWQPNDIVAPDGCDYLLRGGEGNSLVLDFGREVYGGVRISVLHVSGGGNAEMRIRFGESVTEIVGPSFFERRVGIESDCTRTAGNTGFRFVRLDLCQEETTAELQHVQALSVHRDIPHRGSFSCSDERLNGIWRAGVNTVHLCMQTEIWDGIKRDQKVWAGDLYPAAAVVTSVFGEHPIVPASLDRVRDSTVDRQTDELSWMNGISAYSLWWILTQHQWFMYHGNRDYLEQQRVYLKRLISQLAEFTDGAGRERLDGWRYLDWATTVNNAAIHAGLHALFVLAMRAAMSLCEYLSESELGNVCRECESRLTRHSPRPGRCKQAGALLALARLRDPVTINRKVLAVRPLSGLTPFLAYVVLQARALAGDDQGSLQLARGYWGGMLDLGATTFWEDFDHSWVSDSARIDEVATDGRRVPFPAARCPHGGGMSLCHAWAGGVSAWLSQHVLGVRPARPGCRVIDVDPHIADLKWVEGTFPTPDGPVYLKHVRGPDGNIKTVVDAPKSIETRLAGNHVL